MKNILILLLLDKFKRQIDSVIIDASKFLISNQCM